MTNGDMIKIIFPNIEHIKEDKYNSVVLVVFEGHKTAQIPLEWWNEEYERN